MENLFTKTAEIERRKTIKKDATVKYESHCRRKYGRCKKIRTTTTSMKDEMVKESKDF